MLLCIFRRWQAAIAALEAKVALLDANHVEHVDARLQVTLLDSVFMTRIIFDIRIRYMASF